MHGRPRVTVKAEGSAAGQQKAAESNKKALRLRALQEKVLTWHQQNVYSAEALAASASLLELNPDVYVTWNYRKKAFAHRCHALEEGEDGGKKGEEEQEGEERERDETARREKERKIEEAKGKLADEELRLIETALRTNPKCYGAWHHRKWLFALSSTEPLPSLGASLGPSLLQVRINLRSEARIAREQKLLKMMLSADDRNFHAWDYWRFISHLAHVPVTKDLAFTLERINANFSNYSAWHSRSKLLPKLHSQPPPGPAASEGGLGQGPLDAEFELVRQAFFTEPDDQSGWMYLRWLLQQILPLQRPRLLATWPTPGSTLCCPEASEKSPEASSAAGEDSAKTAAEAAAKAAVQGRMSAVLVFSEPVVGVTRESVTLTGAGVEVGEWRAVGGETGGELVGRQTGCGEGGTGGKVRSGSASVWTAQVVCTTSRDLGTAAAAAAVAASAAGDGDGSSAAAHADVGSDAGALSPQQGLASSSAAASFPTVQVSWAFARPSAIRSAASSHPLSLSHKGSYGSNCFTLQLRPQTASGPPTIHSLPHGTPSHVSSVAGDWTNFRWPPSSPSSAAAAATAAATGAGVETVQGQRRR
ncbi:hypothetical protein CLOM_g6775 [Closterium sp. NIES-68]|nr:hypothetical protein CLOM_g6775 [Closterium sp. NIES-68]